MNDIESFHVRHLTITAVTFALLVYISYALDKTSTIDDAIVRDNGENDNNWFLISIGHYQFPQYHLRHQPQQSDKVNCFNVTEQVHHPVDFLTAQQRNHGGVLLHLIIATYSFLALTLVCEYYFVPAVETMSYGMGLQEDVGATLISLGSTLPWIIIFIIKSLTKNQNIDVGTALASTVYNIMFVLGVCSIALKKKCKLAWWPYIRNTTVYCTGLILMLIFSLDLVVKWEEATVMLVVFAGYLCVLVTNKTVEATLYSIIGDTYSFKIRFEDGGDIKHTLLPGDDESNFTLYDDNDESETLEDGDAMGYPTDPPVNPLNFPHEVSGMQMISHIILIPIKVILFLTIPDLRRPSCQPFLVVTYVFGAVWITVLTYLLLWALTVIETTLEIPLYLMRKTLLNFAGNISTLVCGLILVRKDRTEMAISQAITSNSFIILLGLGISWLVKTRKMDSEAEIENEVVLMYIAVTFALAMFMTILLHVRKFTLERNVGCMFVGLYIFYLLGNIIFVNLFNGSCLY